MATGKVNKRELEGRIEGK